MYDMIQKHKPDLEMCKTINLCVTLSTYKRMHRSTHGYKAIWTHLTLFLKLMCRNHLQLNIFKLKFST